MYTSDTTNSALRFGTDTSPMKLTRGGLTTVGFAAAAAALLVVGRLDPALPGEVWLAALLFSSGAFIARITGQALNS